ncbi:DEAD/DEAH box helicase, partial [Alistipes finegoldii]
LFFSATMPSDIVTLANSMLHDPVHVTVTPPASVVETISQSVMFAEKAEKKDLLISLLRERSEGSVLVFSRTKHGADRIARILTKAGIEGRAIHGDKSQGARERAMNDFRAGRCRVLIATDIAARGIDISELPLVINYDLPEVAETYVHRIGRTGRAGHDGTAIAFCSEDERPLLKDIQKLTGLVLDPDSGRLTPGMQTDTKSPRKQESSKQAAPKQAAQGAADRTPAGQSGDAKGPRRHRRNAPKREGQAQSAHAPQPQNGGGQASENREPGRRRPHRRKRSDRKSEGQRS